MHTHIAQRFSEKARVGIWGFIVGDALGVPYEFMSREDMFDEPATGMSGWGTYDQPPGTWSDDTSMMLCVLENIHAGGKTEELARLFLRWAYDGYHTPHGRVFDIGITTRIALDRYRQGNNDSGLDDKRSAGNGSLMRSLPYAFGERYTDGAFGMLRENQITHRAWLCQSCCLFYTRMARALAEGESKVMACRTAIDYLRTGWSHSNMPEEDREESLRFSRLFDTSFSGLPMSEIRSSGYVIESLEAAVWSFMHGTDYRSTVLNAVNLGGDTDTNAALAGGLAAIHYGMGDIPGDWLDTIVGRRELEGRIDTWLGLDAGKGEG